MNAKTRKEIEHLISKLNDIRSDLKETDKISKVTFESLLEISGNEFDKIKETVRALAEDEREKADNMFERFSGTERYDAVDMAASSLEDAVDSLESIEPEDEPGDIINAIEDAIDSLEDAKE